MVYFRIELHAKGLGLDLPEGEELKFHSIAKPEVVVTIHNMTKKELHDRYFIEYPSSIHYVEQAPETVCVALGEYEPPEEFVSSLQLHFEGKLPPGVTEADAIRSTESQKFIDFKPSDSPDEWFKASLQKTITHYFPLSVFGEAHAVFIIAVPVRLF